MTDQRTDPASGVNPAADAFGFEVTDRIRAEVRRQRRFKRTVAQLAGIPDGTWGSRERRGNWTTREIEAVAKVLRVSFESLAGGPR